MWARRGGDVMPYLGRCRAAFRPLNDEVRGWLAGNQGLVQCQVILAQGTLEICQHHAIGCNSRGIWLLVDFTSKFPTPKQG